MDGHSSGIMAPPTPQEIELESAFRQFAGRSDPITQHNTATLYFPAEKRWQQPVDILPADELEIKLSLIKRFFEKCEDEFDDVDLSEPPRHWIAAMLQFDIAKLQHLTDSPFVDMAVWIGLPAIGPLIKKCLAKPVTAKEPEATRSAISSHASGISRQTSKRRATSAGTKTSSKRSRVASENDDDLDEEDAEGGDDIDDHDYRSSSPRIKAGTAKRDRREKAKRLELDEFRCIVCETDSPAVCHIVPFCVNSSKAHIGDWQEWLRLSVGFWKESSSSIDGGLLKRSFTSSEPGTSDKQWNMVCLNHQLHTWWGQARWGFKCLGTTDEGPARKAGHAKLKLQFHWMPRRATDRKVATLGLTLADFKSAFDGNWGDPKRKPLVCLTYPGTGRLIETGDIFYVQVPTSDLPKMELAFQIQWAVLKIAAIAGGAEALEYLPDRPEDDKNGQFYAAIMRQAREEWYGSRDAMAAPGSSAQQRATDNTESTSPVSPPD